MNIKQQLEQVIAYANMEAQTACVHHRPYAHLEEIVSRLSAIVEQMNADEQAIVEEVNKRWPTGKPQPDDTFVGAAPQVPDGMVPAQTVLEWMEEAKEDMQDWACYASEYFKEKHNLHADLVKMDTRIAELRRIAAAKEEG